MVYILVGMFFVGFCVNEFLHNPKNIWIILSLVSFLIVLSSI